MRRWSSSICQVGKSGTYKCLQLSAMPQRGCCRTCSLQTGALIVAACVPDEMG